jgi:glycosyltransferase involved in cell wall biosynthesis
MPTVTVLTAVRNGARYLPETIGSIRAQTWTDWEYILVDDGSTDETPWIIERAAREDERIRLVRRTAPGGPFVAANEGLRHATGTYIVRTDGDDVSLPARIERQVAFLRANPALSGCATFCQDLNDAGPIPGHYVTAPTRPAVLKWYLCVRCPLVHSSACVQRTALLELGGYRELPLAQDYRLWCELARRGGVGVVPEVLVYFRKHDGRLTTKHSADQTRLAHEILLDHLHGVTGTTWTLDEAAALWALGLARVYPIRAGLEALDRWDASWTTDPMLERADREELARLSAFRRRKFLRCNARRQPADVLRHLGQFLFPAPSRTIG